MRHRCRDTAHGWSLVELVMAIGVSLVVGGFALAAFGPLAASARAVGAARHLAATLQRERLEAIRSGRAGGLRFHDDGTTIAYERVADGNGNGLRNAEIDDGIDVVRSPRVRVADAFAGVRFAIVDAVPSIDGGPGLAAGADPIRLGSSILAFASAGSATSGTLYLASADRRQFAVRILGATGRVRIFEFDRTARAWVAR